MGKRENSSGSIVRRKRSTGIIYEAFSPASYTFSADGKLQCRRELLGRFAKKSEARAVIERYLQKPSDKYNYTVFQLYSDWSASAFRDLSPQTCDNWTAAWAKVRDVASLQIPDKLVRDLTADDVRKLLEYYASPQEVVDYTGHHMTRPPLSHSYVTKIKALMTQLCDYAIACKIVDVNYAKLAKLPKMQQSHRRAFTDQEFNILEQNWRTVPGGDAVYALCYLGFRVSEFCSLTCADYDRENKTLRGGLKTNAGRDRIVPIHKAIQPIIDSWAARGCSTLYADDKGRPYNKDSFRRRVWIPVRDALGLSCDLNPHSARHTCATRLSAGGARPEDIQRILGHADYSETANDYINQDVSALHRAIDKM